MTIIDACCWCFKEIEITMKTKVIIGSKTGLEWYVCPQCLTLAKNGMKVILELVKEQDLQFHEEDLEAEKLNEASEK